MPLRSVHITMPWITQRDTFQNLLIQNTLIKRKQHSNHLPDWNVWCKITQNCYQIVIRLDLLTFLKDYVSVQSKMIWKLLLIKLKRVFQGKVHQLVKQSSITLIESCYVCVVLRSKNANQSKLVKSNFLFSQWFIFHLTLPLATQ